MLFQAILILAICFFAIKLLSGRRTHIGRAWQKLGIFGLLIMMLVGVISPRFVTEIANFVGIGRGADLLLYLLFIAFIFFALSQYLKFQDQRDLLYRLARRTALVDAFRKYKINIS